MLTTGRVEDTWAGRARNGIGLSGGRMWRGGKDTLSLCTSRSGPFGVRHSSEEMISSSGERDSEVSKGRNVG